MKERIASFIDMENEKEYKSYQCQKCGECIGWLGRFIEWITFGIITHNCNKGDENMKFRNGVVSALIIIGYLLILAYVIHTEP